MRVLKRLTVWLAEIIVEALLLALFVVALLAYGNNGPGPGVRNTELEIVRATSIFAVAITYMFILTGYLLTTGLFRGFWRNRQWWSYSAIAAALFVIHFEIMSVGFGGAFDFHDRIWIMGAGVLITFMCSSAGTLTLRKWEPRRQEGSALTSP